GSVGITRVEAERDELPRRDRPTRGDEDALLEAQRPAGERFVTRRRQPLRDLHLHPDRGGGVRLIGHPHRVDGETSRLGVVGGDGHVCPHRTRQDEQQRERPRPGQPLLHVVSPFQPVTRTTAVAIAASNPSPSRNVTCHSPATANSGPVWIQWPGPTNTARRTIGPTSWAG